MAVNKINRVVLSEDIKTDIDNKATKIELQNTKNELVNLINEIYQGISWKATVPTFADISVKYSNPLDGWAVIVGDEDTAYLYDSTTSKWQAFSFNQMPLATSLLDGKMSSKDKAKLDTVKEGAEKNLTITQVLEQLKTVDGVGSGLDADTFQGKIPTDFSESTHLHDGRYNTKAEVATMLGGKVDKIVGKQLSTEDYTTVEKAKLAGVETGANKYIHPSTHSVDMIIESTTKKIMTDAERTKLGGISTNAKKVENSLNNGNIKIDGVEVNVYTHPTGTNPHGTTKSDVGLSSVDNIQQASKAEFNTHNNDNIIHVTALERADWNSKETTQGSQAKANVAETNAKNHAINAVSISSTTTDPNTTQESYILTNHINSPGGGVFWHILTMFYSSRTSNRAQIAVTYNGASQRMMIRHYYQSWTSWKEVASITDIPTKISELLNDKNYVTAAELGTAGYGDMLKSVYDKNNNGKVDNAEVADSVAWAGVNGKPSTFPPSGHTHNYIAIPDTRSISETPLELMQGGTRVKADFKFRTAVDNPPVNACASSSYAHVITIVGWSNSSGGLPTQLTFNKSIAIRQGISDTAWGAWTEMASGSYEVRTTAPTNKNLLWIDTSI